MQVIYCYLNMFDYEQSIYLNKDKNENPHLLAKVPLIDVGKVIPDLCNSHETYDVMLSCPVPGMAQQCKDKIEQEEFKRYNTTKINVTIM